MKKILLLVLLSIQCFAEWNTIQIADEFGDKTSEIAIINYNKDGGWIRVRKVLEYLPALDENGQEIIKDYKVVKSEKTKEWLEADVKFTTYLGGSGIKNKTYIKIKNEKNEVSEELMGFVWSGNSNIFTISQVDTPKFLEFLEKSKIVKIAATNYADDYYYQTFDVTEIRENEKNIIGGFDF